MKGSFKKSIPAFYVTCTLLSSNIKGGLCKMKNNPTTNQTPYLKILQFGVYPKCLQQGSSSHINSTARTVHFHCTNSECERYLKDKTIPLEISKCFSI